MRSVTLLDGLISETNDKWFSLAFLSLRILLGFQFLLIGVSKIILGWTTEGYLLTANGPFAEWFQSMASNSLISHLNIWGLTLIGLALIIGLMVRPASFFGSLLMLLYYFAHFEDNTANGIIDYHLIYVMVFLLFMAGGAGSFFGLDRYIKNATKNKWIHSIVR